MMKNQCQMQRPNYMHMNLKVFNYGKKREICFASLYIVRVAILLQIVKKTGKEIGFFLLYALLKFLCDWIGTFLFITLMYFKRTKFSRKEVRRAQPFESTTIIKLSQQGYCARDKSVSIEIV